MTPQTGIYKDARLGGDDFYDFIDWFWTRFQVPLPGKAGDYAPGESSLSDLLLWPFARLRRYQPLTIADLAALVPRAGGD